MLTVVTAELSLNLGLIRTLNSISLQTVPLTSIVIDGSTDSQLRDYVARRFPKTIVLPQKAQGVYQALNYSLTNVSMNDYVLFLNGNDFFTGPDSVEILLNRGTANGGWAAGQTIGFSDSKNGLFLLGESTFNKRKFQSGNQLLPHMSTLIPAAWLKELNGFDTRYKIAGDADMAYRIYKRYGDPTIVPVITTAHEMSGVSTTNKGLSRKELRLVRIRNFPLPTLMAIMSRATQFTFISKPRTAIRVDQDLTVHFHKKGVNDMFPNCCHEVLDY